MLKFTTALVSTLVLILYGLLAYKSSDFTLLSPRGGILMLGISLVLANAAVWASQQRDRALATHFQLVVVGWIGLAVQLGSVCYLLAEKA